MPFCMGVWVYFVMGWGWCNCGDGRVNTVWAFRQLSVNLESTWSTDLYTDSVNERSQSGMYANTADVRSPSPHARCVLHLLIHHPPPLTSQEGARQSKHRESDEQRCYSQTDGTVRSCLFQYLWVLSAEILLGLLDAERGQSAMNANCREASLHCRPTDREPSGIASLSPGDRVHLAPLLEGRAGCRH